jgi:hypothetical protein
MVKGQLLRKKINLSKDKHITRAWKAIGSSKITPMPTKTAIK